MCIAAFVIAWLALFPHSPYTHSWVYRVLQAGFNIKISVDFELDGKPYSLHRTLRCRYEKLGGYDIFGLLSEHPKWDRIDPAYTSFGIKTERGEGVIINLPNICQSPFVEYTGEADRERVMSIPDSYVPAIAIADNADAPNEIIVYASHQAYKSPNARLKYNKMQVTFLKGWQQSPFITDDPDQFAFFGGITGVFLWDELYHGHRNLWRTIAFAAIPMDEQDRTWHGFTMFDYDQKRIDEAKELAYLDHGMVAFENSAEHVGVMHSQKTYPAATARVAEQENILENIIPYRLKNGIWEPEYNDRGRLILLNPDIYDDNCRSVQHPAYFIPKADNPAFHVFSRKIRLGGKLIEYEYGAHGMSSRPTDSYADYLLSPVYLAETKTIYIPLHSSFSTYPMPLFK